MCTWDGRTLGRWAAELDGADAVVNLAGRSVSCRHTAKNLREMMDSRVDATKAVGTAIANASRPPKAWLQMSTATVYARSFHLGGPVAGGRQYASWIHERDFVRAILFLLEREDIDGPVNIAAPNPVAEQGVHANDASGLRGAGWPAGDPVDGRARRVRAPFGHGTAAQEPTSGHAAASRGRLRV